MKNSLCEPPPIPIYVVCIRVEEPGRGKVCQGCQYAQIRGGGSFSPLKEFYFHMVLHVHVQECSYVFAPLGSFVVPLISQAGYNTSYIYTHTERRVGRGGAGMTLWPYAHLLAL